MVWRLKTDALLFAAPVCSSWVWMSRSCTKRTPDNPLGDVSRPNVVAGNLQVSRCADPKPFGPYLSVSAGWSLGSRVPRTPLFVQASPTPAVREFPRVHLGGGAADDLAALGTPAHALARVHRGGPPRFVSASPSPWWNRVSTLAVVFVRSLPCTCVLGAHAPPAPEGPQALPLAGQLGWHQPQAHAPLEQLTLDRWAGVSWGLPWGSPAVGVTALPHSQALHRQIRGAALRWHQASEADPVPT